MKATVLTTVLFAAALSALAGQRTSTNYFISADVLDAGGQSASTFSYANVGSAGTIAGTSQYNPVAEVSRQGYVGQLYEVTTVILAASSTNVPAGSTTQLSATARLDDSTSLVLDPTQVAWSVLSGPITGIASNGVATAGTVSQNTAATVRGDSLGRFGTLQLMVLVAGGQPQPRIVTFYLSGANAVFSGTNGAWGGTYSVLTSTNITLPLASWTSVVTNNFDGSGNFSFTNAINPAEPRRFFLLRTP